MARPKTQYVAFPDGMFHKFESSVTYTHAAVHVLRDGESGIDHHRVVRPYATHDKAKTRCADLSIHRGQRMVVCPVLSRDQYAAELARRAELENADRDEAMGALADAAKAITASVPADRDDDVQDAGDPVADLLGLVAAASAAAAPAGTPAPDSAPDQDERDLTHVMIPGLDITFGQVEASRDAILATAEEVAALREGLAKREARKDRAGTVYAILPDGTTKRRVTTNPYTFAVANRRRNEDGSWTGWDAPSFSRTESGAAKLAAELAKRRGDRHDVRVVPCVPSADLDDALAALTAREEESARAVAEHDAAAAAARDQAARIEALRRASSNATAPDPTPPGHAEAFTVTLKMWGARTGMCTVPTPGGERVGTMHYDYDVRRFVIIEPSGDGLDEGDRIMVRAKDKELAAVMFAQLAGVSAAAWTVAIRMP